MKTARALVMVIGGSLALAATTVGCSPGTVGPSLSPSSSAITMTAQEQLVATRTAVSAALTAYAAGEANKALESATDAYLEHFEFVESALEAVDAELVESIEEKLRDDMRAKITAGAPNEEVSALGNEILVLLDEAVTKLQ